MDMNEFDQKISSFSFEIENMFNFEVVTWLATVPVFNPFLTNTSRLFSVRISHSEILICRIELKL